MVWAKEGIVTNATDREALVAQATELRKKCEARIPGLRKIVQDGRDSGDPDRLADAAFVLGWMSEVSDYVGALRELADV